jgi:hypothetical protein
VSVDFAALLGTAGPCGAGCGAALPFRGVCDPCAERRQGGSSVVPKAFRWAQFGSAELAARCPVEAIRHGRAVAQALATGYQGFALFEGATGSGKTSLACAILSSLGERGTPGAFLRARFAADDERRAGAARAGLLVLDNLGEELDGAIAGSPLAAMRIKPVVDLLIERSDDERPTIITTWLADAERRAIYSAGVARLLIEGNVIPMEASDAR